MADESWKYAKVDQSADVATFKPEEAKAKLETRSKADEAIEGIIRWLEGHPILGWWVPPDKVKKVRETMKAIADFVVKVLKAIAFPAHAYKAADAWENDIKKPTVAAKERIGKTTSEITETWKDDAGEVYEKRAEDETKAMEKLAKIGEDVKKHLQEIAKTIASFYIAVMGCIAGYVALVADFVKSASQVEVIDVTSGGALYVIRVVASAIGLCGQVAEKLAALGKDAVAMVDQQVKAVTELKGRVESDFPDGWPKAVSSNMAVDSE